MMILLVYIDEGTGNKLYVEIDIVKNSREENTYKFHLLFADGRKASSIRIVNVGQKPFDYPCYLENEYKNTPDFYMKLDPDDLFEENDLEILRITLRAKTRKGERNVTFTRVDV